MIIEREWGGKVECIVKYATGFVCGFVCGFDIAAELLHAVDIAEGLLPAMDIAGDLLLVVDIAEGLLLAMDNAEGLLLVVLLDPRPVEVRPGCVLLLLPVSKGENSFDNICCRQLLQLSKLWVW